MRNRIRALLARPHRFFMYPGGAGGEFICHKLSEYSPAIQQPPFIKVEDNPALNRTIIGYPKFYEILFWAPTRYLSTNETVELLAKELTLDDIRHAEDFWLQSGRNPFLRCHHLYGEVFDKLTTYTLLVDSKYWWNYSCALLSIKVLYTPEEINKFFSYVTQRNYLKRSIDVDAIVQFMKENNIASASDLHLNAITSDNPNLPDIKTILKMSVSDLLVNYNKHIRIDYLSHIRLRLGNLRNSTPLSMNRVMTEPDYLASHFEITDPQFFKDIQIWHSKNLELLEANQIDHSRLVDLA